jgi:hypothetical protein
MILCFHIIGQNLKKNNHNTVDEIIVYSKAIPLPNPKHLPTQPVNHLTKASESIYPIAPKNRSVTQLSPFYC